MDSWYGLVSFEVVKYHVIENDTFFFFHYVSKILIVDFCFHVHFYGKAKPIDKKEFFLGQYFPIIQIVLENAN